MNERESRGEFEEEENEMKELKGERELPTQLKPHLRVVNARGEKRKTL